MPTATCAVNRADSVFPSIRFPKRQPACTMSPRRVGSRFRFEERPTAAGPQVPAPVRGVIEKQGGEKDSRGWWQRFKSRIGFGKD